MFDEDTHPLQISIQIFLNLHTSCLDPDFNTISTKTAGYMVQSPLKDMGKKQNFTKHISFYNIDILRMSKKASK